MRIIVVWIFKGDGRVGSCGLGERGWPLASWVREKDGAFTDRFDAQVFKEHDVPVTPDNIVAKGIVVIRTHPMFLDSAVLGDPTSVQPGWCAGRFCRRGKREERCYGDDRCQKTLSMRRKVGP